MTEVIIMGETTPGDEQISGLNNVGFNQNYIKK